MAIIFALLVTFIGSQLFTRDINAPITLAFLGIASGLVGAPDGWVIVKRGEQKKEP